MKSTLIIALVVIVCFAGIFVAGYFVGRNSVHEVHTTTPAEFSLDSLQNAIRLAELYTEDYARLLDSNQALREALHRRRHPVPADRPDTAAPPRMVATYAAKWDSMVTVRGTVFQGEDTIEATTRTRLRARVKFVGEPANAFILEDLRVSPFRIALPVREQVREAVPGEGFGSWFSAHAIGGWNGAPAVGGLIQVGWLGGGVLYNREKPIYFATFRIVH